MPAYAQNGTAFASVAYDAAGKTNADTSQENYVLFYQHSSGDIRKIVWNQTTWYPSEFVTNSARIGTGLSAVSFGAPPTLIYLYCTDRDGILQELRGAHASNEWNNGTLGTAGFKVNSYSALSAKYQGKCGKRGNIGWVLYQSDVGIQEALWDHDQDSWSNQVLFKDIQPGSDLVSTIKSSAITAWRLFGIKKNLQLQEYVCNTPCTNASNPWVQGESIVSRMDGPRVADDKGAKGLNGVAVTNSTLEIGGASVNNSRLIYFQDPQSNIRELNNTDFSNPLACPKAGWQTPRPARTLVSKPIQAVQASLWHPQWRALRSTWLQASRVWRRKCSSFTKPMVRTLRSGRGFRTKLVSGVILLLCR